MSRLIAILLFLATALPLRAACTGTDLLAALPADQRAALEAAAANHPYAEGLLWRAERGGQVIHLVGTLHIHDPRHAATLAQIDPLIASVDTVFLEFAPGDEQRLQRKMARDPSLAFITEGPTLPDRLGPADWATLKRQMSDRGIPGFLAAKMKPWMAMTTLALTRCAMADIQAGRRGLDHMILGRAEALGTKVRALEPVDTLFEIFGSYTEAEQLDFLRMTLAQQLNDPDAQMVTLIEAYFREEVRLVWEWSMALARDVADMTDAEWQAELARAEDALLIRRNQAWMDRILPAADRGEILVAAGALHLPGEYGLLNLLAAEGFALVPIQRKDGGDLGTK